MNTLKPYSLKFKSIDALLIVAVHLDYEGYLPVKCWLNEQEKTDRGLIEDYARRGRFISRFPSLTQRMTTLKNSLEQFLSSQSLWV